MDNTDLILKGEREENLFNSQRTSKGKRFERYLEKMLHDILHPDEALAKDLKEVNEQLRQKVNTPGAVSRTQLLENIAVAYANDEFIGDRILPIVPTADSEGLSVEYWLYDKANKFSYPGDEIGTAGKVNEVSEGVTRTSTALVRRALREFSDAWTQAMTDNVVAGLINPMMNVLDGMAFNRELRQAAIAGVAGSFGANTSALAGGDIWNSATGGDPGKAVDAVKLNLWGGTGPGRWVAYTSRAVFNVLKRHPVVLDTFKYQGGKPAQATREMLAAYFEVDELLVGDARKNTANEGQTASYSRIWPNIFGVVRVSQAPSRQQAFFGMTLQQQLKAETWYVNGTGGRGGYFAQGSTAEKSLVVAADTGYLLTGVIS